MLRFIKIIAVNVLIFFVLIVFVVACLETYLRFSLPYSSEESIFEYSLDTKRYKVMRKDTEIYAWGVELRTNSLGFRDNKSEIPAKKPGEYRIIVLGDSFTVSAGVDYDLIYTSLLEKKINDVLPQVKIINLAVGGYNIIQYKAVLEEVGLSLSPDMVLVFVFPYNDFEIDNYKKSFLIASGQNQQKSLAWYKTYYVYRAYLWRLEFKYKKLKDRVYKNNRKPNKQISRGWEENLSALEEISTISKKNNIIMATAILPNTGGFSKQREIVERLKEFCSKRGILTIDLYESFIENGIKGSDLVLNLIDSHPNEKYNELVANIMLPSIVKLISKERESNEIIHDLKLSVINNIEKFGRDKK